jgi:hypothetical protein
VSLREIRYLVSAEVNPTVEASTSAPEPGITPVDTTDGAVTITLPAATGSRALYGIHRVAGNNDLIVAPAAGEQLGPDQDPDDSVVMVLGQTGLYCDIGAGLWAVIGERLPEAVYPTLSAPAPQTTRKQQEMTITFTGASGYGAITYTPTYAYPSGSSATFTQVSSLVYTITPDVEGSYVVELRLEDSRGRYITKTAIITFASVGAVWNELEGHRWDFRAATPNSRTGSGTLNVVIDGTTIVATAYNSAGNQSFGCNATDGLYAEVTAGTPQTMLTVPTTIDTSKKYAIQWLWTAPTFANTSAAGRIVISSSTNSTTGTQILPHGTTKNATSGLNFVANTRSSGTSSTALALATGMANPGTMCTTLVVENRQAKWTTHAASDFVDMADVEDSAMWNPVFAALGDPSPGFSAQWITNPKVGIEMGNSSGKMAVQEIRVLTAVPTMA